MAIINGRGRVGIRRPSAAAAPSIVLDGLKLYLDAGNATSYAGTGTVWTDLSGNGNNATLVNGPTYNSANSGSIVFDGADDVVSTTYTTPIGLNGFTYECWLKYTAIQSTAIINKRLGASTYEQFTLYISADSSGNGGPGGKICVTDVKNTSLLRSVATTTSLNDGNWHHAVATRTSTSTSLYVDGNLQQTSTSAAIDLSAASKLFIGRTGNNQTTEGVSFNGSISNIKIYNRALSSSEVLQNYNVLKSRFYPQVSDSDAQAFIYAAGIQNSTQANAVNTLVTSMKTAGVWTKMKAVYPMVGGSAASHKFNLKDPRDLNAAYRLAFAGTGWVHSSTGAKPNGSSDYANTFLNASGVLTIANNHISFYSITNPTTINSVEMGASDIFGYYGPHIRIRLNGFYGYTNTLMYTSGNTNNYAYTLSTNTDARGHFIGNILSTTNRKTYKNGNVSGVNTSNISQTLYNGFIYLGALNNINTAAFYTNRECAFATIGDGLTDAEASSLYTAVQAFQTALGRQV